MFHQVSAISGDNICWHFRLFLFYFLFFHQNRSLWMMMRKNCIDTDHWLTLIGFLIYPWSWDLASLATSEWGFLQFVLLIQWPLAVVRLRWLETANLDTPCLQMSAVRQAKLANILVACKTSPYISNRIMQIFSSNADQLSPNALTKQLWGLWYEWDGTVNAELNITWWWLPNSSSVWLCGG